MSQHVWKPSKEQAIRAAKAKIAAHGAVETPELIEGLVEEYRSIWNKRSDRLQGVRRKPNPVEQSAYQQFKADKEEYGQ